MFMDPASAARAALDLLERRISANASGESTGGLGLGAHLSEESGGSFGGAAMYSAFSAVAPPSQQADQFLASLAPPLPSMAMYSPPPPPFSHMPLLPPPPSLNLTTLASPGLDTFAFPLRTVFCLLHSASHGAL